MNLLTQILLLLGCGFNLVAALGVLRFPDAMTRLHAATKAGAFGSTLLLLAACFHFGTPRAIVLSLLVILFFYLTAPIAAYVLGRVSTRNSEPNLRELP